MKMLKEGNGNKAETYSCGVIWVTVRRQLSSEKECSWNNTHSGRPSLGLLAP